MSGKEADKQPSSTPNPILQVVSRVIRMQRSCTPHPPFPPSHDFTEPFAGDRQTLVILLPYKTRLMMHTWSVARKKRWNSTEMWEERFVGSNKKNCTTTCRSKVLEDWALWATWKMSFKAHSWNTSVLKLRSTDDANSKLATRRCCFHSSPSTLNIPWPSSSWNIVVFAGP